MRPIDADALIRRFHDSPTFEMSEFLRTLAIDFVKDAPTIPAVEVVRCRECKHYREAPSQTSDNAVVVWCAADKYPHNDVMPDDWYCAAGEREEYNHE